MQIILKASLYNNKKMTAMLSKSKNLFLSSNVVYSLKLKLILFKIRVNYYHYIRLFLILLLHPVLEIMGY